MVFVVGACSYVPFKELLMFIADGPVPIPSPSGGDLMALLGLLGHNWLVWIMAVVVVWLLVTRLAETYEGAAKILGPLGQRIAKRYQSRNEKYRKQVAEEAKLLALELVPKVIPVDYEAVKTQLQNVIERVTDLETENAALRSYVIVDEQWHFDVLLAVARTGEHIDFPHRYTWLEFREKWRMGWRPGAHVSPERSPLTTLISDVGDVARREEFGVDG